MNSNVEKLQRTRSFPTIRTESAAGGEDHWLYMHSDIGAGVRPCCRAEMLEDMWSFMSSITFRDGQRQTGKLRSDALAQERISAHAREQAEEYFRQAHVHAFLSNNGMAGQCHFQATTQGIALHQRNGAYIAAKTGVQVMYTFNAATCVGKQALTVVVTDQLREQFQVSAQVES